MTVFSGSFAERGSSPKQKALMDQEVAFEKVCIATIEQSLTLNIS